jgi:hypothetical protein
MRGLAPGADGAGDGRPACTTRGLSVSDAHAGRVGRGRSLAAARPMKLIREHTPAKIAIAAATACQPPCTIMTAPNEPSATAALPMNVW